MKSRIIFILMVLFTQICYSQIRIGFSKDRLLTKEFVKEKAEIFSSHGEECVMWQDENVLCLYGFDENDNSNWNFIEVKNDEQLNFMIREYNKNYVPQSDSSWIMYSTNTTFKCKIKLLTINGKKNIIVASKNN